MLMDEMTSTIPKVVAKEGMNRIAWRTIAVLCLMPAGAYLLLMSVTLALGDPKFASWVLGDIMDGQWSIPLFWLVVIGGPLLSIITTLIVQHSPTRERVRPNLLGIVAWVILVLCLVTCLPWPWLLMVVED